MKRHSCPWRIYLSLAVCVCVAAPLVAPALARQGEGGRGRRGRVDWIFVLDTSASMRGAGGSRDIFDKVKTALETFINSTESGDSVTVYTFDRDTALRPTVQIVDESDRAALRRQIRELQATGDRTHTGKAIRDALDRARELRARGEAERRTPSIVLLTDGIEDVRGIPNPVTIPSNVQRIPSSQPYIFYVSLGDEHDPQLDEFVHNPALQGRGEVLRDPGAANIGSLGDRIRAPVEEAAAAEATPTPTPTPVHVNVEVEPIRLDFGEVRAGRQSARQTLNVRGDTDVAVQLALEGSAAGVTLAEPSGPIALKAGASQAVSVRLAVADAAADGPRSILIKANVRDDTGRLPPDAVIKTGWAEASLSVVHVPLWRTLLWWLAVALIVLLVALVAYCVSQGALPWELWQRFRERHHLVGELEVLNPRPAQAEQAYIDLKQLELSRLALSTVVPDGAAGADDAELEGIYAGGAKGVRLRRTSGGVRVNGAEVSFADLYDGDTIELGDARLRFNWTDHDRPAEAEDGLN
ncbi:MAG TPA: VWA domain-containing protein [Pyrinomonadaceae bacterium]|nr:VWA domain-containing protein [Pyrinomonadaceae bacterium]